MQGPQVGEAIGAEHLAYVGPPFGYPVGKKQDAVAASAGLFSGVWLRWSDGSGGFRNDPVCVT